MCISRYPGWVNGFLSLCLGVILMNEPCIFCGNPTILGSFQVYSNGYFRQTYICRSCGRQYVNGPAFTELPDDRRINTMDRPPCPRCGCEDTMFNDWLKTKITLKPRFKCKSCNRSFTVGGKLHKHKKYDEVTNG